MVVVVGGGGGQRCLAAEQSSTSCFWNTERQTGSQKMLGKSTLTR